MQTIEVAIHDLGDWTLLAADDGGWSLSTGGATHPEARLQLSADAAWRLLTGAEVHRDAVRTIGESAVVDALTNVRAIIV